jgi:hypothetical protein
MNYIKIKGASQHNLKSINVDIPRDKLEMEKVEKKFEEWLIALRAKSHIEIKL